METIARLFADLIGIDLVYGYLIVGILIGVVIGALLVRSGRPKTEIGGGLSNRMSTMTKIDMRTMTPGTFELEVNGQKIDVDPKVMAQIREFVAAGKKIDAIKALREATGLGLAEAKNLAEMMEKTASLRRD
jgi:hypothetical protein